MPPRGRKPRTNPLIPAPSASKAPIEQVGPAPICGVCWPDGWASLPEGSDFASCPHGDWSTTEGLLKRAATEPAHATIYLDGKALHHVPVPAAGQTFPGVTTDDVPVTITWRGPGEPALVSLVEPTWDEGMAALTQHARAVATRTGETPIIDMTPPVNLSPFAPRSAPAPVEIQPEELDTGDDVMFMPSGG